MKHIMLLFLSEVHLDGDKKLSLSPYKLFDGTMIDCVQTNESAVRWTANNLRRQQEQLDCLFYFSTKRTQEELCYIDDENHEHRLTHEALFLNRIGPFAANCVRIDYNERSQTEESVRQVLEMADAIRDFMEEHDWKPEDVALHADFTGGFRHASMMMLSVMQLLKYYGIGTTAVLYSNRNEKQVENVTDIYRMFNLISGADEFINFGSTREITAYMEGSNQTAETKVLLQTMRDFTNAVRICRTGKIAPLAGELQEALQNFERAGAISLQEKIFLRILAIFKMEYGSLLKKDFTKLDIIRWCVEKGYLQQAMTLCTEWMPEEIIDSHIFYPIHPLIQNDCKEGKTDYQTWQYYFLNTYSPADPCQQDAPLKIGKPKKTEEAALREVISHFVERKDVSLALSQYSGNGERIKPLLDELQIAPRVLRAIKNGRLKLRSMKKRYPKTYAIIRFMYLQDKKAPTFNLKESEYFKRRDIDKIYHYLEKAPYELLKILVPFDVESSAEEKKITVSAKPTVDGIYLSDENWNKRQYQYLKMLDCGFVQCRQPAEEALEVLHDYYKLRSERNNINHANNGDTLSTQEVKELVLKLLRGMESRL
ncbi:TM1812 family CRISPR-associated protein [Megasphaera sp. DISK 18]|uniref:TM1812 family CRISPR-associated protein n=1 Tax=Megasphaera sp. DISK 18 TaxID=1776081 RepID=UPI0008071970|nr:TM1812 family CRISPR-associated protein [Megasphaera sp. DISK 18]OBZ32251.1 hypothetical protein A0U42_01880 [Megasphaera sp. DISK 18]